MLDVRASKHGSFGLFEGCSRDVINATMDITFEINEQLSLSTSKSNILKVYHFVLRVVVAIRIGYFLNLLAAICGGGFW
jgi:hypothetical protein